jgi:hypothetical protein
LDQETRGSGEAFHWSRSFSFPVRAWLSLAILAGLAAGRVKDEWRAVARRDPDLAFSFVVFAFSGLGIAGIGYGLWHVIHRPSLGEFLGMKRFHWLLGAPLAWLCGVAIGLFWRYL